MNTNEPSTPRTTREVVEDAIDASKDPEARWDAPANPKDYWENMQVAVTPSTKEAA